MKKVLLLGMIVFGCAFIYGFVVFATTKQPALSFSSGLGMTVYGGMFLVCCILWMHRHLLGKSA